MVFVWYQHPKEDAMEKVTLDEQLQQLLELLEDKKADDEQGLQKLFTVLQVQKRLECGRTTVYSLMESGKLRSVKIGNSRRVLGSDLDSYIRNLS